MYKVIEKFKDKDGATYNIGDEYKGDRVNALSTKKNKYKRPFIEKVEESNKEEKQKESNTEENQEESS